MPASWNSLEIAKLIVAIATPVAIFVLGIWVQRSLKRIEQLQWANRQIVEKRIRVYDETTPLLNDLLCFFIYVGDWKELSPRAMVDAKRKLDKTFHLAAPLFSEQWLRLYNTFIHLCFKTYNKMGDDAKLRTTAVHREAYSSVPWQSEWDDLFAADDEQSDPRELINAYDDLMQCFAAELGLGITRSSRLLDEHPA